MWLLEQLLSRHGLSIPGWAESLSPTCAKRRMEWCCVLPMLSHRRWLGVVCGLPGGQGRAMQMANMQCMLSFFLVKEPQPVACCSLPEVLIEAACSTASQPWHWCWVDARSCSQSSVQPMASCCQLCTWLAPSVCLSAS